MRKETVLFCAVLFWLAGGFCHAAARPLQVFVSVPPQAYLAERIGGDNVRVSVLVAAGQDPHTFEPTPLLITDFSRADIFFTAGLPFEDRIIKKIKNGNPHLRIVNTVAGIKRRTLHGAPGHHHDGHGAEADLHVWLSPPNLEVMSGTIERALADADPAHADLYRRNYDGLIRDIKATNADAARMLKPYKGRTFFVFHPAFGYFADTYGLRQQAVEFEGKTPSPRHLAELIRMAKSAKVKTIFVQPQFDKRSAAVVANAIGADMVTLDPLARDVLANLKDLARKIQAAME